MQTALCLPSTTKSISIQSFVPQLEKQTAEEAHGWDRRQGGSGQSAFAAGPQGNCNPDKYMRHVSRRRHCTHNCNRKPHLTNTMYVGYDQHHCPAVVTVKLPIEKQLALDRGKGWVPSLFSTVIQWL